MCYVQESCEGGHQNEKSDYKEIYEHIYVRLEKINIYPSIRHFMYVTYAPPLNMYVNIFLI